MSRLFGAIRQNGYVVRDIEVAMRYWSEVLGVGPWFHTPHAPIQDFTYRGDPSHPDVAIALANSGPLQLELIQQHNDAPSLYRDFLADGQEGLQHIAYWTENFASERQRAIDLGFRVGHEGVTGRYGPFVYFETKNHPGNHAGTILELSDVGGLKHKLFQHIRAAAETWDGRDPVRDFPEITD
jgi:catechol 2,3-dioxygenase-like lactoylglutathione lyase family enzyme